MPSDGRSRVDRCRLQRQQLACGAFCADRRRASARATGRAQHAAVPATEGIACGVGAGPRRHFTCHGGRWRLYACGAAGGRSPLSWLRAIRARALVAGSECADTGACTARNHSPKPSRLRCRGCRSRHGVTAGTPERAGAAHSRHRADDSRQAGGGEGGAAHTQSLRDGVVPRPRCPG